MTYPRPRSRATSSSHASSASLTSASCPSASRTPSSRSRAASAAVVGSATTSPSLPPSRASGSSSQPTRTSRSTPPSIATRCTGSASMNSFARMTPTTGRPGVRSVTVTPGAAVARRSRSSARRWMLSSTGSYRSTAVGGSTVAAEVPDAEGPDAEWPDAVEAPGPFGAPARLRPRRPDPSARSPSTIAAARAPDPAPYSRMVNGSGRPSSRQHSSTWRASARPNTGCSSGAVRKSPSRVGRAAGCA